MSITDVNPEAVSSTASGSLIALRQQIDALDDRLHDLLMERAALIERVKREGGKTGTLIRVGREAVIVRRLLDRHHGALAPHTILRIWRELFTAALMIEGGLSITVTDDAHPDMPALAREHFGPLTPLRRCATPAQALADLAAGTVHVAVLPLPSADEDAAASWWIRLMQGNASPSARHLSIIARLPFWSTRLDGTPQIGAYVVAAIEPDASGADRSLIGLRVNADASSMRISTALKEAGFSVHAVLRHRLPQHEPLYALAEVEGLVARDDPRLAALHDLAARPEVLGAYAIPVACVSDGA